MGKAKKSAAEVRMSTKERARARLSKMTPEQVSDVYEKRIADLWSAWDQEKRGRNLISGVFASALFGSIYSQLASNDFRGSFRGMFDSFDSKTPLGQAITAGLAAAKEKLTEVAVGVPVGQAGPVPPAAATSPSPKPKVVPIDAARPKRSKKIH